MKWLWQASARKAEPSSAILGGTLTHAVPDIRSSALTSAGCVREINEDTVSVVCPAQRSGLLTRGLLAVVADGMGGARGGSCASETAVRVSVGWYLESDRDPPDALKRALQAANHAVYSLSQEDLTLEGMGTTCVAVVLTPKQAWIGWVGDSRVYLFRDQRIFQMTEDHSVVAELVRGGVLTAEQGACHENRHVLTRALGTRPEVDVSVWEQSLPVRVGDRFLLCSDGLHDALTDQDLLRLAGEGPLEQAGAALIDGAKEQGGYDNISAVLLEVAAPAKDPAEENGNRH